MNYCFRLTSDVVEAMSSTNDTTRHRYYHAAVSGRFSNPVVEEDVATTIVTWMEVLRGRFDAILKAQNGTRLQQAFQRLLASRSQLDTVPIVPFDEASALQFDKLLKNRKLKKVGRGDLLIASIALARKATLATRNLRDFRQIPGLRAENWAD